MCRRRMRSRVPLPPRRPTAASISNARCSARHRARGSVFMPQLEHGACTDSIGRWCRSRAPAPVRRLRGWGPIPRCRRYLRLMDSGSTRTAGTRLSRLDLSEATYQVPAHRQSSQPARPAGHSTGPFSMSRSSDCQKQKAAAGDRGWMPGGAGGPTIRFFEMRTAHHSRGNAPSRQKSSESHREAPRLPITTGSRLTSNKSHEAA